MNANIARWLTLATVWVGLGAHGIDVPGWERPIYQADLTELGDNTGEKPLPEKLTMNQLSGAGRPTSFTLVENTGIVCVTAPCPSEVTSTFRIVGTKVHRHGAIQYVALENPKFLPTPHGRRRAPVAPRRLELIDHTGDSTSKLRYAWIVRIVGPAGMRIYGGSPSPVVTIQ